MINRTDAGVAGAIIAGGRSLRFGGEKAAALLDGRPLLAWAAARLRHDCTRIAANVRSGTAAEALARTEGLTLLYDAPGDALGPLAGIKVALAWALAGGMQQVAVSPCDAPRLPADVFSRLIAASAGGAAMAETAEGLQPMCAVWPVAALPIVTAALAHGAHPSLWRTLDGIGARRVSFDDAAAFANVNTREDLERLGARPPAPRR